LFLILRRDLERKGLAMPEHRAAVDTETGNAQDSKLHRQHIALLAARIVGRGLVNSSYFTIRKGGGIEARRLMRVFVEPEADRVLWLHVLSMLDQGLTPRARIQVSAHLCGARSGVSLQGYREQSKDWERKRFKGVFRPAVLTNRFTERDVGVEFEKLE